MSEIRLCCRCGAEHDRKAQRMCRRCKNAYDRTWRARQMRELQTLRKITKGLNTAIEETTGER